jgi:hypothetical protein
MAGPESRAIATKIELTPVSPLVMAGPESRVNATKIELTPIKTPTPVNGETFKNRTDTG